ncbi:MAG TPA: NADH-quinone oxidoreductase subunit C [Bryobacteraceae bacterium]|nr:NADH-quinone oxidoreductase subunit C [Bryobacteraceae bacterium]
MADEQNREGQPAGSEGEKPDQTPPADPQATPPIQDPKTRGQEAALEAALGDPSLQPNAPQAAVPKADPPPNPIEGAAETKPQAGAAGVPPKPAAPVAKPPAAAGKPPAGAPAKPAAPPVPKPPAVMVTTPWESDLTTALKQEFGDAVTEFSTYVGQNFLVAKPEAVMAILEYLKSEQQFDYLVDVTAVDYPKRDARFDLVYVLYSFGRNERIRVKAQVAEGYKPESAVRVHLTANWLEREVFDMFGIEFAGHPDMKRILMPDEWEGYPLRKDYGITKMDERWVQENLSIESGQ